ncbi:MAG: HupE/UreJ family protein [Rhodospirillales bacterium]|nr:HupE/UreJ family protein [Rhodospirillales bacterium]
MRLRTVLPIAALLLWAAPGAAHELRPAYLQIDETEPGRYEVLWKRPQRGDLALGLAVNWPESCRDSFPETTQRVSGALIERRLIDCGETGLVGKRIGVDGLATTLTDVLVRIEFADGRVQTNLLKPASPHLDVQGPRPAQAVAADYFVMGVEHILGGIDHLLFVLGLMLIVRKLGPLVKTVTAFTVAHSLTLAAATLGFVKVSQTPVEAVIALSILFLAGELARQHRNQLSVTARSPWLIAFGFGLLHGLGFAGALAEVGLPAADIPLALLAFNLGVEAGQLLFVSGVLALLVVGRRVAVPAPGWTRAAPAYGIGSLAAFWLVERLAAFG